MDVDKSDLIECNASGSTSYHCESGRLDDFSGRRTAFQMIPSYLSTWPFSTG